MEFEYMCTQLISANLQNWSAVHLHSSARVRNSSAGDLHSSARVRKNSYDGKPQTNDTEIKGQSNVKDIFPGHNSDYGIRLSFQC